VSAAECRACRGDWPPAETLIADCGPANAYPELWELARDERDALMDGVTEVSRALAAVYEAKKMNYELLGNALPHIHWHLVPRRADDPVPRLPVWTHAHEPLALSPAEQRARIAAIRTRLRP